MRSYLQFPAHTSEKTCANNSDKTDFHPIRFSNFHFERLQFDLLWIGDGEHFVDVDCFRAVKLSQTTVHANSIAAHKFAVLHTVVVALNTKTTFRCSKIDRTHNFERSHLDRRGVVVVGECEIVAQFSLRRVHDFADDIQLETNIKPIERKLNKKPTLTNSFAPIVIFSSPVNTASIVAQVTGRNGSLRP